ncbi:MFS transporter [Streptomyces sp. NPDC001984]
MEAVEVSVVHSGAADARRVRRSHTTRLPQRTGRHDRSDRRAARRPSGSGIGTSAAFPCAMVLIRRRAEDAGLDTPPGGVLGGIAIAGMATTAVGPPIGGLLVGVAGWRWAFLINNPVTLIALVMALRWLPKGPPFDREHSGFRQVAARIDLPGILGFATSMTTLVIFLMSLPQVRWTALAVFVLAAAPTAWWELRTTAPFFDFRALSANGALTRTYLRQALTLLGVYSVMYGMTQWMEAAYELSTVQAGLMLLPMGAVSMGKGGGLGEIRT